MVETIKESPTAKQLKQLRSKNKLSIKQISDMTKISVSSLEKMEAGTINMSVQKWDELNKKISNLKPEPPKQSEGLPTPKNIKQLRTKNKLSIKQVSDLIGLSVSSLEKMENGTLEMSSALWDKYNRRIRNLDKYQEVKQEKQPAPPKKEVISKSKSKRVEKERSIKSTFETMDEYTLKDLTKKSKAWFASEVKNLGNKFVLKGKVTTTPVIGEMYIFHYNAKHQDTLPFWDKNPIIFIFNILEDGFLGINFHYLHPKDRIILLHALEQIAYSNRTDVSTKLRLSYAVLQSVARNKKFEKCIHRYLFSYMKTPLKKIHSDDWISAILLPNELWASNTMGKVTNNYVWSL